MLFPIEEHSLIDMHPLQQTNLQHKPRGKFTINVFDKISEDIVKGQYLRQFGGTCASQCLPVNKHDKGQGYTWVYKIPVWPDSSVIF